MEACEDADGWVSYNVPQPTPTAKADEPSGSSSRTQQSVSAASGSGSGNDVHVAITQSIHKLSLEDSTRFGQLMAETARLKGESLATGVDHSARTAQLEAEALAIFRPPPRQMSLRALPRRRAANPAPSARVDEPSGSSASTGAGNASGSGSQSRQERVMRTRRNRLQPAQPPRAATVPQNFSGRVESRITLEDSTRFGQLMAESARLKAESETTGVDHSARCASLEAEALAIFAPHIGRHNECSGLLRDLPLR